MKTPPSYAKAHNGGFFEWLSATTGVVVVWSAGSWVIRVTKTRGWTRNGTGTELLAGVLKYQQQECRHGTTPGRIHHLRYDQCGTK